MVNTRFAGRLGNSMFQIAACIGYAKKYGYQWGVPSDQRESSILTHFPNLPRCDDQNKRYHEHPPRHCSQHNKHFDECHFDYHEIPDLGPDVTLTGFFQSWKYFDNAQEEVKKVFKLKPYKGVEDVVSCHVRRGDYLQHSGSFPPITEEYIGKALLHIAKNSEIRKVMFFSDDIEWCKQLKNIIIDPNGRDYKFKVGYSEGRNEYEDLSLMASCSHHIIANSSFSYWGAFLGHNPNKIVVSPSCKRGNWFGLQSGVRQDCVDLLPPEWIQIEFR